VTLPSREGLGVPGTRMGLGRHRQFPHLEVSVCRPCRGVMMSRFQSDARNKIGAVPSKDPDADRVPRPQKTMMPFFGPWAAEAPAEGGVGEGGRWVEGREYE
jgi:hypothetical protein